MKNRVKVFIVSNNDPVMAALTLEKLVQKFFNEHPFILQIQYQHCAEESWTELSCLITYRED